MPIEKEGAYKKVLLLRPLRAPVEVEVTEQKTVVLIYPKNLGRFERWLQRRIGGPENIRRPLDEIGSKIWAMADGKTTVEEMCNRLEADYGERIEPTVQRVWAFIKRLAQLNLMLVKQPGDENVGEEAVMLHNIETERNGPSMDEGGSVPK